MLQAPMRASFLLLAAVFLAPGGLSARSRGADLGELAGRLGDSSKETRRQAAFELARLGEKAAPLSTLSSRPLVIVTRRFSSR